MRHPADAAERVSQIGTGFRCNIVEQIERLVIVARRAGLHDRDFVAAQMLCGAPGACKILGTDTLVHARAMVFAREQVVEQLVGVCLRALRQFIRPPGLSYQCGGFFAVALGEQDPREREAALGACRLVADETANGCGKSPRSCHRWASARLRMSPMPGQPDCRR